MRILILGGNRFFGKRLAAKFSTEGASVTLLNRGSVDDGLGNQVNRIVCDRENQNALSKAVEGQAWDVVYDQVCFDYQNAKAACEIFRSKTGRYVFTSSQSVYKAGADLTEAAFNAGLHKFKKEESRVSDYAEAKRQAEVAFHEYATFPVVAVRFPIVIGPDDYTGRFRFHFDRIKNGQPLYFPNLDAKISFVTSEFAAEALHSFAHGTFEGPINVASPSPIRLRDFLAAIEAALDKRATLDENPTDAAHSPYGIESDWYMNCLRLKTEYGLAASEIGEWLPQLLKAENS